MQNIQIQPLCLTQDNLNLLLQTYESKIDQLTPLKPIFTDSDPDTQSRLNFSWDGPKNRFFEVRWDNHYYNMNVWQDCKCKDKYMDGPGDIGPIKYCDCGIETCSDDTGTNMDFVHAACPKSLEYDKVSTLDKSPYYNKPDKYHLRTKLYSWDDSINIVNLASIGILQRNIVRLDKELQRQESFKWTMATIRTLFLVGRGMSVWHVLNSDGLRVQVTVPHEMVILIMYWVKF